MNAELYRARATVCKLQAQWWLWLAAGGDAGDPEGAGEAADLAAQLDAARREVARLERVAAYRLRVGA